MICVKREHGFKGHYLVTLIAVCIYKGHQSSVRSLSHDNLFHGINCTAKFSSIQLCNFVNKHRDTKSAGVLIITSPSLHRSNHVVYQELRRHQIWCAFTE